MNIILKIKLYTPDDKNGLFFTKKYCSNNIPSIGDKVKDSIFVEFKKVIEVIYDYANEQCFVILESKEMPNGSLDGHVQEVAELHKWSLYQESE